MIATNQQRLRVGIFGTYGFGNMGDAAVADANIAGLKRHLPNMEALAICQQPENVRERHQIEAVSIFRVYIKNSEIVYEGPSSQVGSAQEIEPITSSALKHWIKSNKLLYPVFKFIITTIRGVPTFLKEIAFSFKVFGIVRTLDLMVMSGSGQINEEWGGPWRFPFGMFRWALLAKLAGCKIAFLSVGAGEIVSPWTKFFCSSALKLANYRSVRDAQTKKLIESWGVRNVLLVPDMAFSIRPPQTKLHTKDSTKHIVGINPIPYCDPRTWNIFDPNVYHEFVKKWVLICNWLIKQGYILYLIPNDLVMDNLVLDDIVNKLDPALNPKEAILRPEILKYSQVIQGFVDCDFVITCRFHGLLFSFLSNKPAIALAHHYKFFKLAEEMKQGKFAFDIASFDPEQVKLAFNEIVSNQTEIKLAIKDSLSLYSNRVEDQFASMGKLVKQ